MKKISQYCQSCRAANEPGEKSCRSCGTPLMLVVYPPGMRHDEFAPKTPYEDHLLERISLLEMRLMQLSDSLSMTLQVIGDQSRIMSDEHNLVRELYESLKFLEAETREKIKPKWDEAFKKHELGSSHRIVEILAADEIKNLEMLELLIRDAFEFIEKKDERQIFAALKRAEPIAPKNVPLFLLYAEQLFYADKFDDAKQKLKKAFKIAPNDERVRLLLGAIFADELEIEKAENMLAFSSANERINCAVQIISGMMAAFENDLNASAECFEKSLEKFEFAETNYLLACVFFQKQKYKKSLKYFQKAIEIDDSFTDAHFLKSLVCGLLDKREEADLAAQTALENMENGAQCMEFYGAKKLPDLRTAMPFLHFENKKRLLTGGAQRIRKFVRSLVFYILNG